MSHKKIIKLQIKGVEWSFIGLGNAAYVRHHGSKSDGVCIASTNQVFFNISTLLPRTVRHELFHAYVDSTDTYCSGLDAIQVEELCSVIYAEHGKFMDYQAEILLNFFMRKGV